MGNEVPQIGDRVSVTYRLKAGGEKTVVGVWRQTTHGSIVIFDSAQQQLVHVTRSAILLHLFLKLD